MFPLRSILVAVDFSSQSRAALTLAARLARQSGAALHVLYAESPLLVAAAEHDGIDLASGNREELARFVATAPPAAACRPQLAVINGEPGEVILHTARRDHADVIVMGARGLSGAGRLLFGSVAEAVLLHADRSVLVTPDGWTPPAQETDDLAGVGPVVVGVDFSEPSLLAARVACQFAEQLTTSVEALHVVPGIAVLDRWKPHAERALAERMAIARRDLAQRLSDLDTPVRLTTRVDTGSVAECLAEAAAPSGDRHPLLVLGRRGPRGTEGAPGAIAYRVASIARVPVLMHRPLISG